MVNNGIKKEPIWVRIYMLSATEDELSDLELDTLSKSLPKELYERRERANAKNLKRDRALAYTALMYAVYESGIDPDKAEIVFSNSGKPSISGSKYYISVSHASNVGIAAISNIDIGIDMELLDEKTTATLNKVCERFIPNFHPYAEPMQDFFYDAEQNSPAGFEIKFHSLLPEKQNGKAFLEKASAKCYSGLGGSKAERWTCAEALLKLDGRGMSAMPEIEKIRATACVYTACISPADNTDLAVVSLATE